MVERWQADVVIIGSGVAGAMIAYKLAGKGIKVLMLEAGPKVDRAEIVQAFTKTHNLDLSSGFPNAEHAPRPDWNDKGTSHFAFTGPAQSKIEYLRVVGGTTWHWGGSTPRFMPVEMRMKTAYGVGVDWPIDYDTLEPFYGEAEREMGVAGDAKSDNVSPRSAPFPLPPIKQTYSDKFFATHLEKIGIACASKPSARNSVPYQGRSVCQGFGTCSPICPSGAQYHAMVHVELAQKAGAVLKENARVDRLLTDASGRIVAAEGKRADGTDFSAQGKTFVLASGGIETTRLLLMNKSESHPDGLANSSGQLGKNFMDHQGLDCSLLMKEPVFSGRGPQATLYSHTFRDGEFRSKRAGWILEPTNVLRLHDVARDFLAQGLTPPQLDAAIRNRITHQLEIGAQLEQLPHESNSLTLDWSKRDSAGQPTIKLHYAFSDYEQASFAHVRQTYAQIAKMLGAEVLGIGDAVSHHHPMGTTRMGHDPRASVVDAQCRAHDHNNLFIISSSVFPTGGTVNPTLTIAALALRAAEAIVAQWVEK